MKFNKIIAICKKSKTFIIHTTDDGELQWLSNGYACYPLHGHPLYDEESIFNVASMTDKQAEKCLYTESTMPKELNADDIADDEQEVQELFPQFYVGGSLMMPVSTSEGLKFINRGYLAPIEDEESYQIYERHNKRGIYFVIKAGMFVKAIVTESDIISEKFVESIADIHSQIATAYAIKKGKEKAPAAEQMKL